MSTPSVASSDNIMTAAEVEAFEALMNARGGRRRSSAGAGSFIPRPAHLVASPQVAALEKKVIEFRSLRELLMNAHPLDRAPKKADKLAQRLYRQISPSTKAKGASLYPTERSIRENLEQGRSQLERVRYEHHWRLEEVLPFSADSPRGGVVVVDEQDPIVDRTTSALVAIAAAKGRREYMEDAHLIATLKTQSLEVPCYGLFDGHSSPTTAKWLSEQVAAFLTHAINERERELQCALDQMDDRAIENLLTQAIVALNEQLRLLKADEGSGSTLCLLLKIKGFTWCVNSGDSRALCLRKTGELLQLSQDAELETSSFVQSVQRRGGVISDDPAFGLRLAGVISVPRALGDFAIQGMTARPKVIKCAYEEGDSYFLGCDGVWETMIPQQLAEYFQQARAEGVAPEELTTHLMRYAFLNGSGDNLTLMGIFEAPAAAAAQ